MNGDAAEHPQFDLTREQREIAALAAQIARSEIAPNIARWDKEHTFPRAVFTKLSEAGLAGIFIPETYGGAGADYVSYVRVIEELARVDAGIAVTLSVHLMVGNAIYKLGTAAQRDRWLPLLVGDNIAAFALTEPGAGSDAAAIRSTATADANGFAISGRKQWCTNGAYAAVIMGMFRTGEREGARGVSAFLIPGGTPGITIEREAEKLGIRTSNTCDVAFDGAHVGRDALLGSQGEGFVGAMSALAGGRIGIAAQACGILAACLDASVKFAKERTAFGKPIGSFEGVAFKIAQMATDLEAARLLTYRAAALCDKGLPFATQASHAKYFASTAARRHASEAVQIHGGYGFTTEFPVERYYRDAKITEIYEGTSEIQQIIIARSLLGKLD